MGRRRDPPGDGKDTLPEVQLFPLPSFCAVAGSSLLAAMHEAQRQNPIMSVWDPKFRLPKKLVEYTSAVCCDFPPQIRQEAVLLLKRYAAAAPDGNPNLQVVALTCANLAMKHWMQRGIPESKLHMLSRNAFTQQDFIDAEIAVLGALKCNVHWDGVLLAEWVALLLHMTEGLLAKDEDAGIITGVASHVADILAFQDDLMFEYLPSELAAASLHASVMLCTKRFQRYSLTLRIGHLCRMKEERMLRASEQILELCVGGRCADLLLEGSGITADDSGEEAPLPLPPICRSDSD